MSADQLAQYVEYINTTSDADIMIFVEDNDRKRAVQCNNLICKWSGLVVLKWRSRTVISFHIISNIRTKWFGFKRIYGVWQFFANDQAQLQKGQPSTTMCYIGNHMIHKISLASCKGDGWVL